jgi:hypothetical protein
MSNYYLTDEWKNHVAEVVGMNDMAVELMSRFAHDIYVVCRAEYQKSNDINAMSPVGDIQDMLAIAAKQAIHRYYVEMQLHLSHLESKRSE